MRTPRKNRPVERSRRVIVITEFGAVKAERPVFCLDENPIYTMV